jgi:uncharacterized NAD(P)/FAD-binding protein YdhS
MGAAGDRAGRRADAIIIGGGAGGALMALHLLRADSRIQVTLIENNSRIGRGMAYATASVSHLLNVPAGAMAAFDSEPDHFCDWLCKHIGGPATAAAPKAIRCMFVPRGLYGEYLASLLAPFIARGEQLGGLSIVHAECLALEENRTGVTAVLTDGARHSAEFAVLATGHDAPSRRGRCYVHPWTPPRDSGVEQHHCVLLLGTGLTMIDYMLSLEDAGHRGPIIAMSRRGLLPLVHRTVSPLPINAHEIPFGADVSALLQWLRARVAAHVAQGGDWREVVDGIRLFNQQLWRSLPVPSRQRFLRHGRAWWNVHRHRMAPEIEARIANALRSDRLVVMAAKVTAVDENADGALVTYRRRGERDAETVRVDKIADCRGVVSVPYRPANPALRDLLVRGHAQLDPLEIGLDVNADAAIVDGSGRASQRLFAIGPLARAAFWEITAIAEIRRQCAHLARRLRGAGLRRAS